MNEYQNQLRRSVVHLHRAIYEMGLVRGNLNAAKNAVNKMTSDLPSVLELNSVELSSQEIGTLMRFNISIRDILAGYREQLSEDEILEYMDEIINVHIDDFGDIDVTALADDTCNWFRDYNYNVLDARTPEVYMKLALDIYDENVGDNDDN